MALYKDGNPVSGLNSIPRLTLAQYNALNVKPEFWVRTDAPESYKKLSADQVSYDSNTSVKEKIDEIDLTSGGTITNALNIKPNNALGVISLGKGNNSSEYGVVQMYDDASHWLNIMPSSQTDNRAVYFPDKTGTVALTSDLNWTSLGDITSGGTGVDVSQYNTICILPKMQGWAIQNPQIIPKLPNTASSVAVYVSASYYFSYRINFSPSGVLSIDNEALSGWTTCVYGIFAQ